jgi:Holliday junction DNA helicase RuvA
MIYFLEGTVGQVGENYIILTNSGVGYQVFVNEFFLAQAKVGQSIKVFTSFHLSEESARLYGFNTEEELSFFNKLNNIPNIGPKSAMNILSAIKLPDLRRAILDGDEEALNKISGIGKKTASRIIIEMRDKIKTIDKISGGSGDDAAVIDGLVSLGYNLRQAREAVRKISPNIAGTSARLKAALKTIVD